MTNPVFYIHRRTKAAARLAGIILGVFVICTSAAAQIQRVDLALGPEDVVPTGNEWIALPTIRASDAALESFNALSMRDKGLLEVTGTHDKPVLQPYFILNGKPLPVHGLKWDEAEYWIPEAHMHADGLDASITYCAPPGIRAAFVRLTFTNHAKAPVDLTMGLKGIWGALNRVTYTPVELRGDRTVGAAPWAEGFGQVFSFITYDTHFAWALIYPGSKAIVDVPPVSIGPSVDASQSFHLEPDGTAEVHFVFGVGMEEYSATQSAQALAETIDRSGTDAVLAQAAQWLQKRVRATNDPALDLIMNRNFMFTSMYAWGKALDSEQMVGVTSRSPRYYVSAAYWDRDAMLWSFPALLDIDPQLARQALHYALTTQLRNTGTHSRFIDGTVLEDGLELDEADAPVLALAAYFDRTSDQEFLAENRAALDSIRERILENFDPQTGLYSTLQDAQDQYRRQGFSTYDNVLTWKTLLEMAHLYDALKAGNLAPGLREKATALRAAILSRCVVAGPPGADGTIFASATDGHSPIDADVPPGSLLKLPALGFVPESDPVFQRTYRWLHSENYQYSYSGKPYGLPGSYRLPFTTSWSVADHLGLSAGRAQAMKVLKESTWDGGIITEGVDPETGVADHDGRAFATAAGYVADAICRAACVDEKSK